MQNIFTSRRAVAGLIISVPMFRLMATGLAGLGHFSFWTVAVVSALLIAVTMSASYIPARVHPNRSDIGIAV